MTKWKIALLSFAHTHQFAWARAFSAHSQADVVTAWDDNQERGPVGAEQVGTVFVPDLQSILAGSRPGRSGDTLRKTDGAVLTGS